MKKVVAALDYEKHAPSSFHARCCRRAPPSFVPPPAAMAPAAIKTTREPKPWDKLRRNRSQPSSPTERAPSSPDAAALSDGVRSLDVSPDGSANDRGARARSPRTTAAREPPFEAGASRGNDRARWTLEGTRPRPGAWS